MNVRITPKLLKGSVHAISSKSHAHRLLIAAALCEPPGIINVPDINEDILATQSCLAALSSPESGSLLLDCKESGSTLRFLIPVVMALKDEAWFYGSGRLPQRPLSPLKEEMEAKGCSFDKLPHATVSSTETELIFHITGRLRPGRFSLPGNISSQYITGLLFALPLLDRDSHIVLTSPLESKPYIELSMGVLRSFGIEIELSENGFCIGSGQKYTFPEDSSVEGDWSNAAFWLTADFFSRTRSSTSEERVCCSGLSDLSSQGDKEIIPILASLKQHLKNPDSFSIDVSQIPDLLPILSVAATSRITGAVTEFVNAGRLRLKESDRLQAMKETITALGGRAEEFKDRLTVYGTGGLKGGTVNSQNDHRIAMSAAIAASICQEDVRILGADAVNKSYPGFWDDFKSLGGEYIEF